MNSVIPVVRPVDGPVPDGDAMTESVDADGIACNSGEFDGLPTPQAIEKLVNGSKKQPWKQRSAVQAKGLG